MLRSYLAIAIRLMIRNLTFSIINIGGLAICLAGCVFIIYFVYDELTYDKFHTKEDRIHRITIKINDPPNTNSSRFTDQRIGLYLK